MIWASPLCCSGDVSRFIKEPGAFRSGAPNLQTSQLSFTSSLQSSVMKNSGGSSVPSGLPKVTSMCLSCRVRLAFTGSLTSEKLAVPVTSMPPATASHLETTPSASTLLSCPLGWALAPTVPDFKCPRFIDISRFTCPPSQLDSGSLEARSYVLSYQIQSCVPQWLSQLGDSAGGSAKASGWLQVREEGRRLTEH